MPFAIMTLAFMIFSVMIVGRPKIPITIAFSVEIAPTVVWPSVTGSIVITCTSCEQQG
jgi:hypothetical protein